MKIIYLVLIFILGCSGKPTIERFEKIIKRHIGENISQLNHRPYYKIIQKNNTKWYYIKSYNYRNNGDCIYVFITDLKDTITMYKIITPETCKRGIPISG